MPLSTNHLTLKQIKTALELLSDSLNMPYVSSLTVRNGHGYESTTIDHDYTSHYDFFALRMNEKPLNLSAENFIKLLAKIEKKVAKSIKEQYS